jgi:hypothetical protein
MRMLLPCRFLDSSLIDVDVHPYYISIVIKGKVLRLQLPLEVLAESSKAQRYRPRPCTHSGECVIIRSTDVHPCNRCSYAPSDSSC